MFAKEGKQATSEGLRHVISGGDPGLTLNPLCLVNVSPQYASLAIEFDHIAVTQPADRTACDSIRAQMNGRRDFP